MAMTKRPTKWTISRDVTVLIEIAEDRTWRKINEIWSARDFREALYHAIAPKVGGPLWLRQAFSITVAEEMCMRRIPNVWNTLFDQAKDFADIFIDSRSPANAHVIQAISKDDMTKLKSLWSRASRTLDLEELEAMFFPKGASRIQRANLSSLSPVTGKTYTHSVKVLTTFDRGDYTRVFDCLAKYAIDQTPLPPSVTWNLLSTLARGCGLLTNDVLRHIMFWFDGHDLEGPSKDTSYSWADLLSSRPFAKRASPNDGSLMHADKSPNEAARLFVQALFDKIRRADGLEHDWQNESATRLAHQTPTEFLRTVSYLPESSQQVCYRDRFQHLAWSNVVDLVKSYVGSQFQGVMEVYNETATAIESQLHISLRAAIEQSLLAAKLPYASLPFLDTPEAVRDLTSEITIFTAMYLYRHCESFAATRHEATSSDQPSNFHNDTPPVSQEHDQQVQKMSEEATQILREAGFNPHPGSRDERLDRFCLRRLAFLPTESNLDLGLNHQNGVCIPEPVHHMGSKIASETALPTNVTGTISSDNHETLTGVLAVTSIQEQETGERPSKRLRTSDD